MDDTRSSTLDRFVAALDRLAEWASTPRRVTLLIAGFVAAILVVSFLLAYATSRPTEHHRHQCEATGSRYVYGGKSGDDLCVTPDGRISEVYP